MLRLMSNMLLVVAVLVVVTAEGADGHDVAAQVEGAAGAVDLGEANGGVAAEAKKAAAEKADIKKAAKATGVKIPTLTAADKKLAKQELKVAKGDAHAAAKSATAKVHARRAAMTSKDKLKAAAQKYIKEAHGNVLQAMSFAGAGEAKKTEKKLKKVAKKAQKQLKKMKKKVEAKQKSEENVGQMKIGDQVVHYQQMIEREQKANDKAHMKKMRAQVKAQKALIAKRRLGLQKDVEHHNQGLKKVHAILNAVDEGIGALTKESAQLDMEFKARARDDMIRSEDDKYRLSLATKQLPAALVKPLAKKGDSKAVKAEERKIMGKAQPKQGEELGESADPKMQKMVNQVEKAAKGVVNDPKASAQEKLLAGNVHKSAVSVKKVANPKYHPDVKKISKKIEAAAAKVFNDKSGKVDPEIKKMAAKVGTAAKGVNNVSVKTDKDRLKQIARKIQLAARVVQKDKNAGTPELHGMAKKLENAAQNVTKEKLDANQVALKTIQLKKKQQRSVVKKEVKAVLKKVEKKAAKANFQVADKITAAISAVVANATAAVHNAVAKVVNKAEGAMDKKTASAVRKSNGAALHATKSAVDAEKTADKATSDATTVAKAAAKKIASGAKRATVEAKNALKKDKAALSATIAKAKKVAKKTAQVKAVAKGKSKKAVKKAVKKAGKKAAKKMKKAAKKAGKKAAKKAGKKAAKKAAKKRTKKATKKATKKSTKKANDADQSRAALKQISKTAKAALKGDVAAAVAAVPKPMKMQPAPVVPAAKPGKKGAKKAVDVKAIKKKAQAKAVMEAQKLAIVEAAMLKAKGAGKKEVKAQKKSEGKKVAAMKKEDKAEAKAEGKSDAKVQAAAAAAKAEKMGNKANAKAKKLDGSLAKQQKKIMKLKEIKAYKRNKWPVPQVRFQETESEEDTIARHDVGLKRVNDQLKLADQALDDTRVSHARLKILERKTDLKVHQKEQKLKEKQQWLKEKNAARKRVQAENSVQEKMANMKQTVLAADKKKDRKALRSLAKDKAADEREKAEDEREKAQAKKADGKGAEEVEELGWY